MSPLPFAPRKMSGTGEPPPDPEGKLTSAICVMLFVVCAVGIWGVLALNALIRRCFP